MSKVLIEEQTLYDIGDAIREKTGEATTYKPGEMATAISSIPQQAGGTKNLFIASKNSIGTEIDNADDSSINFSTNSSTNTCTINGNFTKQSGWYWAYWKIPNALAQAYTGCKLKYTAENIPSGANVRCGIELKGSSRDKWMINMNNGSGTYTFPDSIPVADDSTSYYCVGFLITLSSLVAANNIVLSFGVYST